MDLSKMIKVMTIGPTLYDTYEKAVEAQIDCEPEYQGEEGLMRAYEDYADQIGEMERFGKTYYYYKDEVED